MLKDETLHERSGQPVVNHDDSSHEQTMLSEVNMSYWSEGIVYCTCGHLLKETVANRGFIEYTLDLLSIPEFVKKKGRPYGHRYGKLPGSREY